MKLIQAYVAGFGRLTDVPIRYETGLTALCMENGWGKTTLAFFHKAMFYGLESGKSKGSLRERERFRPWNGGSFGGWLEFSVDCPDGVEKAYRIERFFGDKPAKDRMTLRSLPDLRVCGDFADPIGLALFGLNADSFIRTVFCTGTPGQPPQTSDAVLLSERFGENPADGRTLSRALDRLEARRVELQTRRGDNGRIPDLRREIFALDRQIDDCKKAAEQAKQHQMRLLQIREQIEKDQSEIGKIREEIDRCSQKQADAAHREHYRDLLARVETLQKEQSDLERFFRGNRCTDETLTLLQKKADDCRFAARYAERTPPFAEESEYESLRQRFRGGLPDEEALRVHREIEEKLTLGRRQEREIRESAEFRRRSERFADTLPDEETINRMLALAQAPGKPEKRISRLFPAMMGLILAGVGVLGWILSDRPLWTALSVILTVVGAALTVLFGILYCKNAGKKEKTSPLTAFLEQYGLSAGDGVLSELHRLRLDAAAYRADLDRLSALDRENRALSGELDEFLEYYHAPDRVTLEGWVNRYVELDKARRRYAEQIQTAGERAEKLAGELSEMLAPYPVDVSDPEAAIGQIRTRAEAWHRTAGLLEEAKQAAEQFSKQHPGVTELSDETVDEPLLARLREQEGELSHRLDDAKDAARREESELADCAEQADGIVGLTEERQSKIEQSEQAAAALAAIERAKSLLTKASQNLSDRYLSQLRERFAYYLQKLSPDRSESAHYRMDGNLSVLSEEAGEPRGSDRLSTGKQDLLALCVRLSLADALMDGQAKFLILDDPFVHLDDAGVKSALTLLREFADDRQILYLTCSRSRMPE